MLKVQDLRLKYRTDEGEVEAVRGLSLNVEHGQFYTLLGPSGCGKTSTLRCIAGLETPTSGLIEIDSTVVYASASHTLVPPHRRNIGMVFQSYAIWPHMTVFDNVAYGLRVRKMSAANIRSNVMRVLDLVQMRDVADRPSSRLSGGQQQRVAVARAIAFSPEVLLFDEPLSNLDAKLRVSMRVELRELQKALGITALYVTHDQEEALAISDRVIVMNAGRIEQIGTPEDIYRHPGTRFVADFVGNANVIRGHARGAVGGGEVNFVTVGGPVLRAAAGHAQAKGDAAALQAAYVDIFAPGRTDVPNATPGTIHRRMFHGDFIQYVVDWPCGQLLVRRPPTDLFAEGSAVTVSFAPEHCVVL
jgi:iron(III) transport system ATP-binding protein